MKIYDEYADSLRGMYSVRFNRSASSQETLTQSAPYETTSPFINTLEACHPNKVRKHKEREEKERV
jgi:hypothetical protein